MRLPRTTTRWWMVAVVVAGTAAWGWTVRERTRRCRAAVMFHAGEVKFEAEVADSPPVYYVCGTAWASMTPGEKSREFNSRPSPSEYRAYHLRRAEYHRQANMRIERAVWRIWGTLPIVPVEPPE